MEPVEAPPKPYHILAQQLMALSLQERGIGRSVWFEWLESVPAFQQMDPSVLPSLVDSMIASQILWSDQGILSFAPEGEAKYGRKNFMELLSVFTSPPLFQVTWGKKELGFVHESTFFNRNNKPSVLLLAGRSWKRPIWIGVVELPTSNPPTRRGNPAGWARDSSLASGSVSRFGRSWQATYRSRTGPSGAPADYLNCVRSFPGSARTRPHWSTTRMAI